MRGPLRRYVARRRVNSMIDKELEQLRVHAICVERIAPQVRAVVEECIRLRLENGRLKAELECGAKKGE